MKIDRLLGITMYLLNRDVVTSRELCEKFEVSQRTIIRDIESLNLAGIPVSSTTGNKGGYEILDTFKLNKQITNVNDYMHIITALRGLCTAVDNKKLNDTLERLLAVGNREHSPSLILDFSVVKEDERVNELMREIEGAIEGRREITFDYTKSDGGANHRTVEPLTLIYQWYAWYLFAFCAYKKDYRTFKLKRIYGLTVSARQYEDRHGNITALMERCGQNDKRRFFDYTLKCKKEDLVLVTEYLGGRIIKESENGDCLLSIDVEDGSRLWFSLLLGFGDTVEVIEPEHLKVRLREAGERIARLYGH
ncbi:MAG: WYL domain-containing protein [Defluviitaleaceae bacterium]|nr:WYL domain-containing protein [Defluviitaleaceae bacterium]